MVRSRVFDSALVPLRRFRLVSPMRTNSQHVQRSLPAAPEKPPHLPLLSRQVPQTLDIPNNCLVSEPLYMSAREGSTRAARRATGDWPRAEVVYRLRLRGLNLRELARRQKLKNERSLYTALDKPWLRGESIIAKAIGVKPAQIWPSRYLIEEANRKAKSTAASRARRRATPNPPGIRR